jgi:DNA-binding SARP family transcriptional activator
MTDTRRADSTTRAKTRTSRSGSRAQALRTNARRISRMPGSKSPQQVEPGSVELRLMNGFELRQGGYTIPFPMSVQRLLAFLAFQERPVQRVYVAGKLWLDASEERAYASLRSALWRANQPGVPLVVSVNSQLALDSDVRVDLHEAVTHASRLIDGSAGDDVSFAGFLLTGELLPDWYDDWLLIEREKYRQLRLHALEALAIRLIALARYGEAAETALAAIAGEPLRESAHRVLIRVHLAEGNPSEALRHYALFREQFLAKLDLSPSPQLDELVAGLTHP